MPVLAARIPERQNKTELQKYMVLLTTKQIMEKNGKNRIQSYAVSMSVCIVVMQHIFPVCPNLFPSILPSRHRSSKSSSDQVWRERGRRPVLWANMVKTIAVSVIRDCHPTISHLKQRWKNNHYSENEFVFQTSKNIMNF